MKNDFSNRIAKNMGRKCVTIEYSEQWCEFIAKNRMAQMSFFTPSSTACTRQGQVAPQFDNFE